MTGAARHALGPPNAPPLVKPLPRLHLVTPSMGGAEVVRAATAVLAAHAPLIQVRCKRGTDRDRFHRASTLRQLCTATGALCLVNDRADVAAGVGADGVHLGADDLPVAVARRILGDDAVIGATCRDPEAARRAVAEGATYLGVGPAYKSSTKLDLPAPLGPSGVEAVADAVDTPVIAIAGVTLERVPELLDAGAWGVAVIGAVFAAPDPGAAVAALLELLDPVAPEVVL